MKKIIWGLALLVLTGCGGRNYTPGANIGDILPLGSTKEQACKSNYVETFEFYGTPRALCHSFWDANYKYYPSSKIEIISNGFNNVFLVYADVNQKMECINLFCKYGDGKLIKITRSFEEAELHTDTAKLAEFNKKKEQQIIENKKSLDKIEQEYAANKQKTDLEERKKIESAKIIELEKIYFGKCNIGYTKGTEKYNNCLLEQEKKALAEKKKNQDLAEASKKKSEAESKQISEKLAKMTPDDRRAFTCSEKFGFRKGSDNFKDCVFKIYSAEIELEKIELQKQLAKANADLAKANAASNEKLANAQTNAAIMQAYAAQQQAIAANTADSLALMESGLRMMSPQRSTSRAPMNCQYHAKMLSCF